MARTPKRLASEMSLKSSRDMNGLHCMFLTLGIVFLLVFASRDMYLLHNCGNSSHCLVLKQGGVTHVKPSYPSRIYPYGMKQPRYPYTMVSF